MGGNAGDGATPPARPALRRAATALGVDKLNAQFSAWAPETSDRPVPRRRSPPPGVHRHQCGHPGSDAFAPLVKQAVDQGIVVHRTAIRH